MVTEYYPNTSVIIRFRNGDIMIFDHKNIKNIEFSDAMIYKREKWDD